MSFSFFPVLINAFNPALLISLIFLAIFEPFVLHYHLTPENKLIFYGLIPFLNGLVSAGIIYILNGILSKYKYLKGYQKKQRFYLLLTAFSTGISCLFINTIVGSFIFGTIVIGLTILKVQQFIHKMAQVLPPNHYVNQRNLGDFFAFFIDLIIFFTVINLILHITHPSFPFNSDFAHVSRIDHIFNTLYFTVVTMTTVGYGDFTPVTHFGRMIVVLECLTSYVMFGLMIGLIARGVRFESKSDYK